MARGVNGYVTINVGVTNGHAKVSPVHVSARSSGEDDRARRARRLRKEGWSYRRISAALEMSYADVCHLLDGDEARAPLPDLPRPLPPRRLLLREGGAPLAVPAANDPVSLPSQTVQMEEMAVQIAQLRHRLDSVLAQNEGLRQELARMERSMAATLLAEQRAMEQRLQAAIKTMLERMIPTSLRSWSNVVEKAADEQV